MTTIPKPSGKSFVALPPGVATDFILNVEVPSMQAKRKMKFGSDRTVREAIQLILRNYPIENLDYLSLYLKNTGIWLEETRRLYTYLLSNEDTLELKYKKGNGVSTETVSVYHENNQSPEFVKIYPETTVKGLIQSLENKKHFQIEKLSIVFNGKTLNLDDTLASQSICDGTTVEFKDKDIAEASASAPPKRPPIPGRGSMMGMNPLAPNPNMLSELREKRLQKSASIANVKPENNPAPPEQPNNELKSLLDKRKSASTANMNPKPAFPSPPVNANPTAAPTRPPRGPPPANAETKPTEPRPPMPRPPNTETKPAEPKPVETKPQMPRPPPNRTAPIPPTRTNVVQAETTTPTTSTPPPRPPPISGRPPTSREPTVVEKEPEQPKKADIVDVKSLTDADIFSFDDFVDFDQAIQEVKTTTTKPKAPEPKTTQPINIPSGPVMPAKTVAAVDDFASALDELDSFDFDVTPTPKTASSSSPPKTFTAPKATTGTSPAATKPLQATPRPLSTFTSPVTVVASPPKTAPMYTPSPPKPAPVNNPPPARVNTPPAAPPPTPMISNPPPSSSPPPKPAPPPRPATPTQANPNYRHSIRFDAIKQPVAIQQDSGNQAKDLWIQKLHRFEDEYNGTIMFTTTDDTTIKDASRKMVELCSPNKEGNKEVESYLRELDRSELINLVGCLTAALSYQK